MKKEPKLTALYETILKLETIEEAYDFFEDLCTINEIQDMADRMNVAKLLMAGETYEQIETKTKMSSATISRVNRCLQHGSGGYRKLLTKK